MDQKPTGDVLEGEVVSSGVSAAPDPSPTGKPGSRFKNFAKIKLRFFFGWLSLIILLVLAVIFGGVILLAAGAVLAAFSLVRLFTRRP